MKDQFVMPELGKVDNTGAVVINFSSEILPQSFSQVMYYLKKEQAILGNRILQDVSSETEAVSALDELK